MSKNTTFGDDVYENLFKKTDVVIISNYNSGIRNAD